MAITLTRNLKLKIDSTFDAISQYNLNKLDTLASILLPNTNNTAILRSSNDIYIQPNSPDIGGSGVGGDVIFGSVGQPLDTFTVNATSIDLGTAVLNFQDTAVGGTKALQLLYKSDIVNSVDTIADRILNIALNGANRNLVLGGNFELLLNNLILTIPVATSWTLPSGNGLGGDVLTNDGTGVLSWQPSAAVSQFVGTWIPSDGATKTVIHTLATRILNVQLLDIDAGYAIIEVDSINMPTSSTVSLTASQPPPGPSGWLVLLTSV